MKKEYNLDELNDVQCKILASMIGGAYGPNTYYGHDWILDGGSSGDLEKGVDLDYKQLSKELKTLREMGYVKYMRGLMDEDGNLQGSGNGIGSTQLYELLQDYLEKKGYL